MQFQNINFFGPDVAFYVLDKSIPQMSGRKVGNSFLSTQG